MNSADAKETNEEDNKERTGDIRDIQILLDRLKMSVDARGEFHMAASCWS